MTVICEALEEVTESYDGKRGKVMLYLIICLDRSPDGSLRNTFDYELTPDERDKFTGKLTGKTVHIVIQEITMSFARRVRFKGLIRRIGTEEVAI